MNTSHRLEMMRRRRFDFGSNWAHFIEVLNDKQIEQAVNSLSEMLRVKNLKGKSFLDIGSGSGLFSLAARRMGARVHSLDYDPTSVACTRELKRQYFPEDSQWIIEEGSVLDEDYLNSLEQYDIIYSWGVLHHTGAMWKALRNIVNIVRKGSVFISIYNDQGLLSRYWATVKRLYVRVPAIRWLILLVYAPYFVGMRWILRTVKGRMSLDRGMSLWYDMKDWLGGYPFEVARPEDIFRFFRDHKFILSGLKTCGGRNGCNEYVFTKVG